MRRFFTLALLGALVATCAVAATPEKKGKPRFLVFGEGDNWALFDVNAHKAERLQFPTPYHPEGVAVSPDGNWLVFTAYDSAADNALLFKWNRMSTEAPVRLGSDHGYHADPAFSADGTYIYFAHHPGGAPPGMHAPKAYAQIHRIRPDGTGLESLTSENGCHFAVSGTSGDALFFAHTPCFMNNSSIVYFNLKTRQSRQLDKGDEILSEPSLAPDGKKVLFSKKTQESYIVVEATWPGWRVRPLLEIPKTMNKVRPQYGSSQTEVLYQSMGAIWSFDGKTATRLFSLSTP